MKSVLLRGGEVVAVLAILGLAGWQVWEGFGDPVRQLGAVAGACAALIGVAVAELVGAQRAPNEPANAPEAAIKEAVDAVLSGLRGFLEESLLYRSDLEGIDAGLAHVTDPARAREAISALRLANRRMEEQSSKLSDDLEAARKEIVTLRETVEEIERQSLVDQLTQVGNRRFFDRALQTDMAACAASGAELCLALADIDRFKLVNDKFGHVVGDHLLKSFAEVLTRGSKGRAKTARYGGEEFALLLPGVPFPEARRIVETLRHELESKRWSVGPNQTPLGVVTASFGLAKLAPGETAESFVNRADARLMRAKALGRNRVIAEDGAPPPVRKAS